MATKANRMIYSEEQLIRNRKGQRLWLARRKASWSLIEADRLLDRAEYLVRKKRGMGYTGNIRLAGISELHKGEWCLRDFWIDYQAAQRCYGLPLVWEVVELEAEFIGYLADKVRFRVQVKSALAWREALKAVGK